MPAELQLFSVAFFGAFCQEIVWWYGLRQKLNDPETVKLFKSGVYWIIVFAFCLTAAIFAFLFRKGLSLEQVFYVGLSFPALLKTVMKPSSDPHLGARADEVKATLRLYFGGRYV